MVCMSVITPDPAYLPGLTKYVSFVDEAGHAKDPRQKFLCLAGLIASDDAWKTLGPEWVNACALEGLKRPFHMKDLAARKGEFAGWQEEKRRRLLRRLITAIARAHAIPIGSVVSIQGYDALDGPWRRGFKDPHFLAFQSLTYQIAAAAGFSLDPGPATMVYAHHPEHSGGLWNTEDLWQAVRKHNSFVAQFMESYQCGEQAEHPGLQAADLWAYELRHHFEVIRPTARKPRWPFWQLVKLGLNYDFAHDFISYSDEHGLSGLGRMSQVQRWGELDLLKPGFVGLHPKDARRLEDALRKLATANMRSTRTLRESARNRGSA
jgi:Protein of unknown function (DUF3800)